MHVFSRFFDGSRWKFNWRYLRGDTPWDTNITPPEVEAFIRRTPAGRALDLGCGTGTNALTLARHGWRVTGVDFISRAIRTARAKAAGTGLPVEFLRADVTNLCMLQEPYDFILDIGCLIALKPEDRGKYASEAIRLLVPGGCYMLYAWLPRCCQGRPMGITVEEVQRLFAEELIRENFVLGEEKGHGSAWYWYRRFSGSAPR